MAQVSKASPDGAEDGSENGAGAGAPQAGASPNPAAPPPVRHNLPLKTAPIVGRKAEMQAIATAFERARSQGRAGRVEIVGRSGVGATSVAVELARRAGSRFAGGAWFLDTAMGVDLAWGEIAAARGRTRTKSLPATVREEKERFATGPQCVIVIDGITSGDQLLAAMPLESRTPPYVFVVCEKKTGITDDVVEVFEVPPQGARKLCAAMLQSAPEGTATPAVRTLDGLGLTASISARTALALQGRAGPLLVEDLRNAAMRIVPLIAQSPAVLELLLIASVMHPSRMAVDALFGAITAVRKDRGADPTPEEIGQAVLTLARAGLVEPQDDRRVSMHPLVQEIVRSMAKGEEDLQVAREAAATGLVEEAEASMEGDEGVEIASCGLHQLRHVEPTLAGAARDRVRAVREKLEAALGAVA